MFWIGVKEHLYLINYIINSDISILIDIDINYERRLFYSLFGNLKKNVSTNLIN